MEVAFAFRSTLFVSLLVPRVGAAEPPSALFAVPQPTRSISTAEASMIRRCPPASDSPWFHSGALWSGGVDPV